jgi:outer membrane immunogenic protein
MRMRAIFAAMVISGAIVIPAHGADVYTPPPATEVPAPAPLAFDWTGVYIGAHGGYGWGKATPEAAETPTQKPEGPFGGLQVGYDFQFGNNVVIGAEADISFADLHDSVLDGNFLTQTSEVELFGTARLRLGYALDRFLPYVTGGLAWVHGKGGLSCPAGATAGVCAATGPFDLTDESTSVGWTIGGGIEYAFSDNWSASVEYLYADLGSTTLTFDLPVVGAVSGKASQKMNLVRFAIDYRFGSHMQAGY